MRDRIKLTVMTAVVAVVIAACGVAQGTDAGSDDSSPGTSPVAGMCAPDHPDCVDTVVVPGDDAVADISYRPIEPEGDMPGEGMRLGEGTLVGVKANTVTIGFWMGVESCYAVETVEVDETEAEVSVEITVAARDTDTACIEIAEARSVTVELSQPLGDRALRVGDVVVAG